MRTRTDRTRQRLPIDVAHIVHREPSFAQRIAHCMQLCARVESRRLRSRVCRDESLQRIQRDEDAVIRHTQRRKRMARAHNPDNVFLGARVLHQRNDRVLGHRRGNLRRRRFNPT